LNILDQLNFLSWQLSRFNDLLLFTEIIISFIVLVFLVIRFNNKLWSQKLNHWRILEFIWTLLPVFVLMFLGYPSLKILYFTEAFNYSSSLSLKIIGHQWYWEYDFPEFIINLMRYPKIEAKNFRLAEREVLILPFNCNIRRMVTSQDVLHSWTLPSIGLKIDACPGRLNFFIIISKFPGAFIGQCSELCGVYHSWIPIFVEFNSFLLFHEWIKTLI